jgi:hypothetical protein
MGPWTSVSYLHKSDVDPAELGPVDVQNTNTFCGFFRTVFYSLAESSILRDVGVTSLTIMKDPLTAYLRH